jgi:MATE family multidrug resistance protein
MSLAASKPSFATALRELTGLALPIAGVQVGLMLMGVVEALIVGHVSAVALAAVALGHLYFFAALVFGLGVMFALDPLVAQGLGAGDETQVTLSIQRGLLIAAGLTVASTLVYLPAEAVFRLLGQPAEVIPQAAAFVHLSIPGSLPALAFLVFRQSLQAMQRPQSVVITIVVGNVFNGLLCAALVLGWFGLPRLGVVGAAWAGTAGRWLMAGLVLWLGRRELWPRLKPFRREAYDLRALGRTFVLGAPMGVQTVLEFGVFAVVALMMGRFGTVAVAGHQVAINLASLTFMVPLGVSGAASVLVGHAVGRADPAAARRAAAAALATGVGWMLVSSSAFIMLPRLLASAYTSDPAVVQLAVMLIPIAGMFQVFDGTQVVSVGVLRGLGDTRAPMWINVLGFWIFGFPVSIGLGFGLGLGPVGLWWGFVAGLAAVAVLLLARVRSRLSRNLARVRIDARAQAAGD